MTNLRQSMVNAHAQVGEQALVDLRAAATAPALFKPEWVDRAQGDYDRSVGGMRVWSL